MTILSPHHFPDIPVLGVGRLAHTAMLVRDVPFRREHEAVSRIAEARLEVLSHGRGDEVGRDA